MNVFELHSNYKTKKRYLELLKTSPSLAFHEICNRDSHLLVEAEKNKLKKTKLEKLRNKIHDDIVARLREKEHLWAKSAEYSVKYAEAINDRFPAGEEAIAKDVNNLNHMYDYIRHTGERFLAGEPILSKNAYYAAAYAEHYIRGRWEEAEPTIALVPGMALRYALNVIKARFPAGEKAINSVNHFRYEYEEFISFLEEMKNW